MKTFMQDVAIKLKSTPHVNVVSNFHWSLYFPQIREFSYSLTSRRPRLPIWSINLSVFDVEGRPGHESSSTTQKHIHAINIHYYTFISINYAFQ